MKLSVLPVVAAVCLSALLVSAQTPAPPQPADRVAAVKQWLAESKAHLKGYQWIETTVVSIKGEEKSTKVASCFYDVTGALQKVPMAPSPEPAKKPGIRGAIIKNKTEEMTSYMKQAVELVKSYVPPSPEKLEASKGAGKMSVDFLPGGQNVRLNFRDYNLPGDTLSVSIESATNHVLGFGVSTYIENPKDAVALSVTVAKLPDGTGYAEKTTLDAKAKELQVTVTNSGYRKAAN